MSEHTVTREPATARVSADAIGIAAPLFERRGNLLFVSGLSAVDADGSVLYPGDDARQAQAILDAIAGVLEQQGASLADVVELVSFHTDARRIGSVEEVVVAAFADTGGVPAWTPVGAAALPVTGAAVMMRAVADLSAGPRRRVTVTSSQLQTREPYGVASGKHALWFLSGQGGAGPEGLTAPPLLHVDQARIAYSRMRDLLGQVGGSTADLIDFTSFHLDIRGAIPTLEEVYIPTMMSGATTDTAATTSHVGSTGLRGRDELGVYTAIADLTDAPRMASTPADIWWNGVYPIAGAARKPGGRLVSIAGHVASAPDGSIVHEGDSEAQLAFILSAIADTLAGFDMGWADVVDVHSFHKNIRDVDMFGRVVERFFPARRTAWTPVGVPGLWFEGYLHEVAAIAVAP